MSRFARSHDGPVRAWAPPESPFRIEYSPGLLREVRIASPGVDAFGLLYGVRRGQTIHLIATRGRAGLDPLGIFAARVRGEVFLTEEDLERFEKADACVAMVISGETGGFFVRDAAGSIETVRSYEEFSIYAPTRVVPRPVALKKQKWLWTLGLGMCLALIPLFYFIPRHPPLPLAMSLSESAGQLRISWNVRTKETLTILDGGELTSITITPDQSTATYARRTGDVTVAIGSVQSRFVGSAPPLTEIERRRAAIAELKAKITLLRAASVAGQTRIAALERRLQ
jgi:hypothetical protein